jgi:hypothetical protein
MTKHDINIFLIALKAREGLQSGRNQAGCALGIQEGEDEQ